MTEPTTPFDRPLLRQRFMRAQPTYADFAFLEHTLSDRVIDRLLDVTRSFETAAVLGARSDYLGQNLKANTSVDRVIQLAPTKHAGADVIADEEALPLAPGSVDLIMAAGGLHWINDLPGSLLQVRQALSADGLFLASFLGGETLIELRQCLMAAEDELEGGVSLRVSPFVDVRDAGALLQRAGFALPVTDIETLTVTYESAFGLLKDLRGMGETNALRQRRRAPLKRSTLLRALQLYQERHTTPEGRVTATFQVLSLTGWAPADSQPKPLRPGSAKTRLADALNTQETVLDDPASGR